MIVHTLLADLESLQLLWYCYQSSVKKEKQQQQQQLAGDIAQ